MVSAMVAIRVGSSSAFRRSKKAAISASNAATTAATRSIRASTVSGVLLHLGVERGLATGDALLGLLADPGDLRLGPVADGGHVVVRLAAEGGGLVGGAGVDLLDDALGVEVEAGHRLRPGVLGGGLHGAAELGHELGRAARRLPGVELGLGRDARPGRDARRRT